MSETKISAVLTVEGLRKFQSDMNVAADAVEDTGKRGAVAGANLAKYGKMGFLAAGAAAVVSVKKFADFDDAMNRVKINSGASGAEMVKLGKVARKMGEKFPASATEVADAMNEILKSGMSVENMLAGGLENALAMATAEGLDMATSATAMSQAMAVFAVEGKDANKVTAALSNVASDTSANINDLTQSLSQVGGTASQAGMSVGDTSAALGVLIQNGLDGSKAGTALNSMLLALRAPTDKAAKALKSAGVEVYDATGKMKPFRELLGNLSGALRDMSSDQERAAFLQKTFGVDAQQAASILSKQIPLYDKLATSARNIDAPVDKARAQMQSLGMQLDTTGESIGNMAMQIAAGLAPAIAAVLPSVQSAASAIGQLSPETMQAGAAFIALTAGLTVAIPLIASATTATRGFAAAVAIQASVNSLTMGVAAFSASLAAAQVGMRALTVAMLANPLFMAAGAAAVIVGVAVAMSQMGSAGAASAESLDRQAVAADRARGAYESIKSAVYGVINAQLALSGSALGVERAQISSAQASARVVELAGDGKKGSLEYKSALLAEKEAILQVQVAKQRAADAAADLTAKQDALSAAAASSAKAIRESKAAYKAAADELERIENSGASKAIGDSFKQLIPGADTSREKIRALQKAMDDSAAAMESAQADAARIRAEFGLLGGGALGATGDVSGLNSELDSLPNSKTIAIKAETSGFGTAIGMVRTALNSLQDKTVRVRTVQTKADGGPVLAMAGGGQVRGAGTATSDSVPAMLSAGEWVLTAKQAEGIGYGTLASLPHFAQGGTWFSGQSQAARASMQSGSSFWKQMEMARTTAGGADDRRIIDNQVQVLKRRLGKIKGQSVGGKGQRRIDARDAKRDAVRDLNDMIRELAAQSWQITHIDLPKQAADKKAQASATAKQTAISAVGAKGSELWKREQLAGTTDTLSDDMAVLQDRLTALNKLGPSAAAEAASVRADIWTMRNVTMPQQAAQNAAQADAWRNEAAMAMGRGFYGASGGAGGGGSMGITDTSGGDAGGVGHAPRPEIDRVWLAGAQLNDLDARSGAGVTITQILGWDEAEDFESSRSKRADGDALGGTRDGSVRVVVKGRLTGSTYQDYHERRRALKAQVRAAVDQTLLKVPDVTYGNAESDYASTYSDSGMEGMERRIVRLTSNLKWGDSYGQFGSEWEFELRSPHRFVESDVAAEAPSGTNAAAVSASLSARTSILAIRGEIAAAPAMDAALKFAGVNVESVLAVRAASSDAQLDTFSKLADPSTLPASTGRGAAFSADGVYMAIAHTSTPYVTIYKRSGDTFTKLADPATLPAGNATSSAFSSDGTYLAVTHSGSPYVTIYKRSGDVFTKLSDPATLPAGTGNGVAFSADDTYMAVAHTTTPYVTIYRRSGDTFTKLSDPATLPTGTGYGATFSPDGTYLAVAHGSSPYVTIYRRSGDTFTKVANPGNLPSGNATSSAFSPDGTCLAVAHDFSPYMTIYKRSGDVFTKLADPSTLLAATAYGAAFSPDGAYLAMAHGASPYIAIYKRSGDVFTKLSDPATLPTGIGYGVAFSPSGAYLAVAHVTSPFATIYAVSGSGESFEPIGTITISPPALAITASADVLPIGSADLSNLQPLAAQDSYDLDTIAGTATPVHRTPLARLIGGGSFIAGIIPARATGGSPVDLSEVVTRSASAGAAIVALGATMTRNPSNVINSGIGGTDEFNGLLGDLDVSAAQVATGMPGWRAKESGANFTASSYARRQIDAALGQPKSRPVIHTMMVKPAASWATATTDLNAFGSGVTKFAHLLTLEAQSGGINYVNALGFFHNGTRLVPACVRYDDKGTDAYRFTYSSGALSITPDPALHVWVCAIIDAGSNVWNAISLVDINTGEPLMYFIEGHDQFDGGGTETTGTEESQATTTTTSGTRDSSVAYPTGADRYIGCGSTAWAASVAGTTVPEGGMGAIITLDAAAELYDHGITDPALLTDASTAANYSAIGASIVEWIRERFAPQSIRRAPIAIETEWTGRVPELHGETVVRIDSVVNSDTAQALGASRTGGLSTEQMNNETVAQHILDIAPAAYLRMGDTGAASDGGYDALVMSYSPGVYWKGDDTSGTTAADASGNGLVGTYVNGPTLGGAGPIEGITDYAPAYTAASSQYMTAAYAAALNPAAVTVPFWFYRNADTGATETVFMNAAFTKGIEIRVSSGDKLAADVYTGAGVVTSASTTSIATGTWYFGCVTQDGATTSLYLDGVLEDSDACAYIPRVSGATRIGISSASTLYWGGKISRLAIIPSALTARNVMDLYLAGRPSVKAADASGNGHHAAAAGGPTFGAAGAIAGDADTAIDFDGTNDRLILPWSEDLNPATTFTVGAWFYRDADTAGAESIIDCRLSSANKGFLLYVDANDKLALQVGDGAATSANPALTSTTTGAWYFGVATYDGSLVRLYLNGVLDNTPAADTYSANTSGITSIGGTHVATSFFNGKLDELFVRNTVLTAQEILAIYELRNYRANSGSGEAVIEAREVR